jgi:PAS domain S-box-containing protein
VVLLDLNLPDSRGLDTVARLCATAPNLPVVVATSTDDEELGVVAIHSGAQNYLMKGQFDPAALTRTLRLAIERKQGEVAASRLAAIVENSDDAIVGHSLEGIIGTWNAGATRLYGYSSDEMLTRDVTTLRESERQYRLLFENSPQPMWVYELATLRFLAVNDAASRHYGYAREEFLGMTLEDIRPAEEVPALLSALSELDGEPRVKQLRRHRKKDGTLIEVEATPTRSPSAGRRLDWSRSPTSPTAAGWRSSSGRRRRWRRWGGWPEAWPTTSTTCWA